jgi:hypothetical protein
MNEKESMAFFAIFITTSELDFQKNKRRENKINISLSED